MKKLIKYKKFLESISSNIWDLDEYDIKEIFFSLQDDGMRIEVEKFLIPYVNNEIQYLMKFKAINDYVICLNVLTPNSIKIYDYDYFVSGYLINLSLDELSEEDDSDMTKEFFLTIKRLERLIPKEYEMKIFSDIFDMDDREIIITDVESGKFHFDQDFESEDIKITLMKKSPYPKKEIIDNK